MPNSNQQLTTSMTNRAFVLLVCVLLPFKFALSNSSLESYSLGLKAYIDGDFSQAEQYWLAGAEGGNAESMFNLGLLHEQSKVATASSDEAEKWFRKAADNNYPAASYHLAQRLFERGGSDDAAFAMLKSAAEQDYAPAKRYLGLTEGVVETKSFQRKQVLVAKSTYQTEKWINKQRGDYWTIQLLAFAHESKVQTFITEHKLDKKAAYFVENKDGVVWYKLIYGVYNTKDKATFARQNLSSQLQEYGPWLRTMASVQAISKG